ncbi:ExbD/TolR family protein [Desulfoferrobacter suflitae]|uniref:ExbD/TolR family protein n=1 Tax=Desulfoferrobacter suflitae TaxID=2865782 RepID=UPI0021648C34|nr:biopolymer transporter ExbD [Desulfoferrobacter suflitae]MCK8601158.1 biopolymer transporter ExbD [Desulfoferrobacter suflitae]
MMRATAYRYRRSRNTELNLAPLIDMIFILLIFFLVTTSFVREAGVDIDRPQAQSASNKEKVQLIIGVDAGGLIYIDGKTIDVRSVRARMDRFVAETPQSSVVIVADRKSETGIVVQILDACRLAGVKDISLSAEKKGP